MRVWILLSHLTRRSNASCVFTTASRKYVMSPMSDVFHLLAILVNVVDPDDMRTTRMRFSNAAKDASSTRKNACAVISFVASFCRFHTPSLCTGISMSMRHLGLMRTSKPHMSKSRLGLSLLYTLTKLLLHSNVVCDRGKRFLMSQKTARPRFTSCFIKRMRWSRGQHFLLL